MSSGGGKFVFRAVGPGDGFIVGDVVDEASVEDPDEAVAKGSKGLVVGVSGGASGVVVAPGSGRRGQGREGPQVDGVGHALVRTWRASTTFLVPDARVMGDVPA